MYLDGFICKLLLCFPLTGKSQKTVGTPVIVTDVSTVFSVKYF